MTKRSGLAWMMAAMLQLGAATADDGAPSTEPAATKSSSDQPPVPHEEPAAAPGTTAPAAEEPGCD